MLERGEKLGQLEDKAEKMRNEAENFSSSAHELMLKYKEKKWYQLWSASLFFCSFYIPMKSVTLLYIYW